MLFDDELSPWVPLGPRYQCKCCGMNTLNPTDLSGDGYCLACWRKTHQLRTEFKEALVEDNRRALTPEQAGMSATTWSFLVWSGLGPREKPEDTVRRLVKSMFRQIDSTQGLDIYQDPNTGRYVVTGSPPFRKREE